MDGGFGWQCQFQGRFKFQSVLFIFTNPRIPHTQMWSCQPPPIVCLWSAVWAAVCEPIAGAVHMAFWCRVWTFSMGAIYPEWQSILTRVVVIF